MDERIYDGLISRYAPSWNAPAAAAGPVAALPPSMPTGRPTNAEFPTAASTPPVSIMTPEPGPAATPPAPRAPASAANAVTVAAPRRRPPRWRRPRSRAETRRTPAPVQLAPAAARAAPRHRRPRPQTIDPFKSRSLIAKPRNHAASSHQACRRLRFRQGTQELGRRAHADRQEKGPAASSHSHHPDDAEARSRSCSRAVRSTG